MAYTEDLIGDWVQRTEGSGEDSEILHKVESVIDGELVTNCGRRLKRPGYESRTGVVMQLPRYCKLCRP